MHELVDAIEDTFPIRLIGVNGAGGEIVRHVAAGGHEGVDVVCVDTDARTLRNVVGRDIDLGFSLTRGLGVGGDAAMGREAVMADHDRLRELVRNVHLLFIVAGTGGGTGTGAALEIARLARDRGVLTIALAIPPHPCAGAERMRTAERGIEALRQRADSLIVLPTDEPWSANGGGLPIGVAGASGDVARTAVRTIVELINRPSLCGVDFSDVAAVLRGSSSATAIRGTGRGEGRATKAMEKALCGLRLQGVDPRKTCGFLVSITVGRDIELREIEETCEQLRLTVSAKAKVVVGAFVDDGLDGELHVTIVAAGPASITRRRFVAYARPTVTRGHVWPVTTDADERRHDEDDPRAVALKRSASLTASGPDDTRFGSAAHTSAARGCRLSDAARRGRGTPPGR